MALGSTVLDIWPLPVARACRNFLGSVEVKESHDRAFAACEVLLKYLAALFIADYVSRKERSHRVNAALKGLARPSLGEWAGFLRELIRYCEEGSRAADGSLGQLARRLQERLEKPELLRLHGALIRLIEKKDSRLAKISLLQLFDLLVRYRNWGLGHGAPLGREAYEGLVEAFRDAIPALLEGLEMVPRMELIVDLRGDAGNWRGCAAMGPGEPQARSLEAAGPPEFDGAASAVYLQLDGRLFPCHPLVVYLNSDIYFLNSGLEEKKLRVEYLSYTTGDHQIPPNLEDEQRHLLGVILGYDLTREEFTTIATSLGEAAPQPDEGEEAPRVLGDYILLRELGRGGMGVVHEAYQRTLGRRVALKVLQDAGDSRAAARFERECRAMAKLHHPNIIPVYEVGEANGIPYFSMALIEGPNLQEIIAERRTAKDSTRTEAGKPASKPGKGDIPLWIERLRDVALAIHYANEQGMIHRDVKPSNLLLDPSGRLILLDFGLVKDESEASLTSTGDRLGTLRTMSPEQVLRQKVDRRTDVWSLGATLYEVLTLDPAFQGASEFDVEKAITAADPEPPRKLNRNLSPELETIVLKALEKNPQHRYQTAGELAEDLDRFLAYRPILARPPGPARRLWKAAYRHKLATLPALVAVTLLSSFGIYRWYQELREIQATLDRVALLTQDNKYEEAKRELALFLEKNSGHPRASSLRNELKYLDYRLREQRGQKNFSAGESSLAEYKASKSEARNLESQWKNIFDITVPWTPEWERETELKKWHLYRAENEKAEDLYNKAIFVLNAVLDEAPKASPVYAQAERLWGDIMLENLQIANLEGAVSFGASFFKNEIIRRGLEQAYARELRDQGRASFYTYPAGTDIFCFRYESHEERLIPIPYHPKRGPIGEPFLEVEAFASDSDGPFKTGDRLMEIRIQDRRTALHVSSDLALALKPAAEDEIVEVKVRRSGKEEILEWKPFTKGKLAKINQNAKEPVSAGQTIHFRDQFGLIFAGYPLEFRDECKVGTTREDAMITVDLDKGSYLFVLRKEGRRDVRYPVSIPRKDDLIATVRLLTEEEIPPGFVYVPEGSFSFGGDKEADQSLDFGEANLEGFFMSRLEVTLKEFLEFVNDPALQIRIDDDGQMEPLSEESLSIPGIERYQLIPRDPDTGKLRWSLDRSTGKWTSSWPPNAPMLSVSWLAANDYACWLARKHQERWKFRLPTDREWEKAARGADRRIFVWGNYPLYTYCASGLGNYRQVRNVQIAGVYPTDESVFGIRDLAGSMYESVQDRISASQTYFRCLRGGSWRVTTGYYFRIANRNGYSPEKSYVDHGLRLAADLPAP